MTIELRDMRWAIAASRQCSLRRAAETLNIRQSTLSRRLSHLECRLGIELFARTNGGTRLTAAGEEFVAAAQHIVEEADVTFARLKARGRGESGDLVLGVCMAFSAGNFRATLAEHSKRHGAVRIRTIDGPRSRLLTALAAGTIDVVLMAVGHTVWSGKSLSLWSERVVVALPEMHPLCTHSVIHWADLAGEPVLVTRRDPGPDYEAMLLANLGGCRNCNIVAHDVGLDRLLGLIGAGLGLALVSEGATGASYAGVTYREMHGYDGPARVSFEACWKDTNRNPALGPFLDLLRERYPDLSPPPIAS